MVTGQGSYDFIVVGGGTAGCVLAARLSENPDVNVLLLEAGTARPPTALPIAWPTLLGGPGDWGDVSVMQMGLQRTVEQARGRGLGGSSAINALCHVRGYRNSYDAWQLSGVSGWSFDDLLPFFRRSESAHGRDSVLRGTDGPMIVGPIPERNELAFAWVDAALSAGHDLAQDPGGGEELGFGWFDSNVVAGERQSAADAYLRPILGRPNLAVLTEATVQELEITGERCLGVRYVSDGEEQTAEAGREVILAAGALGSPHLLLLSGIGPKEHLQRMEVRTVADRAHVGKNLHDHPLSTIVFSASREIKVDPRWALGEAMGLMTSPGSLREADLQTFLTHHPYAVPGLADEGSFAMGFSAMFPHSRGSVTLASNKFTQRPVIDTAYYADDRDLQIMIAALRLCREIGASDALAPWGAREILPGPRLDLDDGEAVRDYLRLNFHAYNHLAGTCRMGSDQDAVVGLDLRVNGIERLRIADASVMPALPSANTNATVLAIAERAASLLLVADRPVASVSQT